MSMMMSSESAADRLLWIAQKTAQDRGRTFRPDAEGFIRDLAARAGARVEEALESDTRPERFDADPAPEPLKEAEAAFRKLVNTMADEAERRGPGYWPDQLGEETVDFAIRLSGLCPCWPIC